MHHLIFLLSIGVPYILTTIIFRIFVKDTDLWDNFSLGFLNALLCSILISSHAGLMLTLAISGLIWIAHFTTTSVAQIAQILSGPRYRKWVRPIETYLHYGAIVGIYYIIAIY